MQDKVQALVRLSEAERAQSRSANSIDSLKKQNQDLTHRLTLATQEKVNALMQLAADGNSSHVAAGGKGVVPSPQKASTWKVQFTTVFLACATVLCCLVSCLCHCHNLLCCAVLAWVVLHCVDEKPVCHTISTQLFFETWPVLRCAVLCCFELGFPAVCHVSNQSVQLAG